MRNVMSGKKRGVGHAKKKKAPAGHNRGGSVVVKGYAHGGAIRGGKMGIMPTNQTTVKVKGGGAATRGLNHKV